MPQAFLFNINGVMIFLCGAWSGKELYETEREQINYILLTLKTSAYEKTFRSTGSAVSGMW